MSETMTEDSGTCGICGVDPTEHEGVEIGLTIVNMCTECYREFQSRRAAEGAKMSEAMTEAERVWQQIRDLRDETPYGQAAVEIIAAALAARDREIMRLQENRKMELHIIDEATDKILELLSRAQRAEADLAGWKARVEELEEALDDLLDGLDANADERCGLTQEQWDKRIENARAILQEHEKERK